MSRAGLTRNKIFEVAAVLADDQGFDALTLTSLARHFDVRLPSLYSHLANSDDLKRGVALLALARLAEKIEEAVAGRSGKEALTAFADANRDFAREHPGLFQAARFPLDPKTAATSGRARLSSVSHSMLRGYDLEEPDRVHATRLIGAFVLGFSLLELAGSFGHSSPEPDVSWKRGIDGLDLLIKSSALAKTQTERNA